VECTQRILLLSVIQFTVKKGPISSDSQRLTVIVFVVQLQALLEFPSLEKGFFISATLPTKTVTNLTLTTLRSSTAVPRPIYHRKKVNLLFAGLGSAHIVKNTKNCDRGLENAVRGRRPIVQARSHSHSLYGPTLSRQITYKSYTLER